MAVVPRIDACGKGLAPLWFSSGHNSAFPCGRKVFLTMQGMLGSNFDATTHMVVHLAFAGSTLKVSASKEEPYGPFDPMVFNDCGSHPYITRTSGFQFLIDAVQARIDGAWSSSEVLTIKASSYIDYNPSYTRSIYWQAYMNTYDAWDSPAPPAQLSRTQAFNNDQACSGSPGDWGTVTIHEDGTITLANL